MKITWKIRRVPSGKYKGQITIEFWTRGETFLSSTIFGIGKEWTPGVFETLKDEIAIEEEGY